MGKQLVSVIIPTYNRASLILKAIHSVWNQTYPHVQLIVVDDGSEDNTNALIGNLEGLEYVLIPHGGHSVARNTGLARAKGSLIATLDSDDTWHPDFLEKCVGAIEQYNADFVFANWYQGCRDGNPQDFLLGDPFISPFIKPHLKLNTSSSWVVLSENKLRRLYLLSCPSPSSSVVMRRSSILTGWNKKLRIGEDWSLYLDMIFKKKGCRAAFTMEKLWNKHVHEHNIFDGKKREEVLDTVVEDDVELIHVYREFLTVEELKILRKKYVLDAMELAKYALIRNWNVKKTWKFVRLSFAEMPFQAFKEIFRLLGVAIANRWRAIKWRVISTVSTTKMQQEGT